MTLAEIEAACAANSAPVSTPHPLEVGELPLRATFFPMGFPLEVRTNAAEVLEINSGLWHEHSHRYDAASMISEVYVTEGGAADCPPAPVSQYQRPIFTHVADAQHHLVIDKERRRTWTSITSASLRHRLYLEFFYFMMPLSTLPVNGIHAACVARNGHGVLLCGDSGAGKSTLSYACARSGWDYISDDLSLLIDGPQRLVTGNNHLVRFRPSAADLFPEVHGLPLTPRAAGKPSIELSTHPMTHVRRCQQVSVDFVVFLNRRRAAAPQLLPYRKDAARLYMCQGLYGSDEAERRHAEDVDHLLTAGVLELLYSDLDWAIERLSWLVEEGR